VRPADQKQDGQLRSAHAVIARWLTVVVQLIDYSVAVVNAAQQAYKCHSQRCVIGADSVGAMGLFPPQSKIRGDSATRRQRLVRSQLMRQIDSILCKPIKIKITLP